jgi:hypothetical protein
MSVKKEREESNKIICKSKHQEKKWLEMDEAGTAGGISNLSQTYWDSLVPALDIFPALQAHSS